MDSNAFVLFAFICIVPYVSHACEFPDFLQSRRDGPTREWHVHNLEYHRGNEHRYTFVVTFLANRMRAEINGDGHDEHGHHQSKSYERRCVLEIEPGQFLVTHNEEESSMQKYMCIEFLKRSDHVAQIRQSELSVTQDPRLCSDTGMTLSHWPLVNKADLYTSYQPCPIEGGFNARFYDKVQQRGFCDVYEGETMIESECMKEEGMFFRFRYDKCIPDGLHMKADQQLFCMADWEHEDQRFVILRDATDDRQWCLRYPTANPDQFIAVLFKDLVCNPASLTENVENIENDFLSVTMVRAGNAYADSLCTDDYEGCSYWSEPCLTPGSDTYMTCAKKCKVCNGTVPQTCTLPRNLWGEWLETNSEGQDIVDVKDTSLSKYKYENFRCVKWEEIVTPVTAEHFEQMFVTTFDNGCKARYTCAEFKMHAPSVLHYKLSQSKVWPFYNADWNNIDCSSFHYRDSPQPAGELHHSRHMKVLISMDSITNVDCGLEYPLEFTVTVENDVMCHGLLSVKDSTLYKNKRLQMLLYDCPNRKPLHEFTCLESHGHGYIRKQTIITESADNTNEYQCWYFPLSPEHTFYHLPMMHCNEGAAAKIVSGEIAPIDTFNVKYTATTTTTTTATPQPPTRIVVNTIVDVGETNQKRNPNEDKYQKIPPVYHRSDGGLKRDQAASYSNLAPENQPSKDETHEKLVSPDANVEQREDSYDIVQPRAKPTGNSAGRNTLCGLAKLPVVFLVMRLIWH